ncbi:ribonuclease HI [Myxococcota bacterium]|nr:ribonuclease HI [Myxococcota bacterium]
MAPSKDPIIIYTDGACSGNPGPAGVGVFLSYRGIKRFISEYLGEATNNIAELTALLRAFEVIKDPDLPVIVYTDSSYAIGVLTQGWKAKKNKELIDYVKQAMARLTRLRIEKVEGHAGIPGNECADELARKAITDKHSSSRYETPEKPA